MAWKKNLFIKLFVGILFIGVEANLLSDGVFQRLDFISLRAKGNSQHLGAVQGLYKLPFQAKLESLKKEPTSSTKKEELKLLQSQRKLLKESTVICGSISPVIKEYNNPLAKTVGFESSEDVAIRILKTMPDFLEENAAYQIQDSTISLRDGDVQNTIEDLRLFEGERGSAHCFSNFLKQQACTDMGHATLDLMLTAPTTDLSLLQTRQDIIKKLVQDSKVLDQIDLCLNDIKNYESDFFHFCQDRSSIESDDESVMFKKYEAYYRTDFNLALVDDAMRHLCNSANRSESILSCNAIFFYHKLVGRGVMVKQALESFTKFFNISPLTQAVRAGDTVGIVSNGLMVPVSAGYSLTLRPLVDSLVTASKRLVDSSEWQKCNPISNHNPWDLAKNWFKTACVFHAPIYSGHNAMRLLMDGKTVLETPSFVKETYKQWRDTFPAAFIKSYNRLIGVSKYLKAVQRLTNLMNKLSEVTDNLELFSQLEDFDSWYVDPKKRIQTPFQEYLKKKLQERQQAANDDPECSKKDILNTPESEKKLDKIIDRFNLQSAKHVRHLLKNLQEDLFTKEIAKDFKWTTWKRGKILATYKMMFDLKKHFYPILYAVGEIDAYCAAAKLVLKHKPNENNRISFVKFNDSKSKPCIKLNKVWNPLTTPQSGKESKEFSIIPNSIELGVEDSNRHMMITGDNTIGKSTFMRSVCYAIWMGQVFGIAPAESAEFTPFGYIFSLKKDLEDASAGYSTHEAQLRKINLVMNKLKALSNKGIFSLASFDEIFNGTNYQIASSNTISIGCEVCKLIPNTMWVISSHAKGVDLIERETSQGVCNYKISGDRILARGVNPIKNITNLDLMRKVGFNEETIANAERIEQELASAR